MKSQSINIVLATILCAVLTTLALVLAFGQANKVNASSPGNNYLAIGTASTTFAVAGTSSTLLFATSTNPQQRTYAMFSNDSTTTPVYISLGLPAAGSNGIRIAPQGNYVINDNNLFSGSVYGIASSSVVVNIEAFQ